MSEKKIQLLDCTLRDGSYVINFQFTANDAATISKSLETAGIELIEIGHGVGLGASDAGFGRAAASDTEYMEAVSGGLERAQWGMFCIPGIAKLEHIDMAAEYGMDFIRIGTNVTDIDDSQAFIERAKHHDMMVCANYMKSYASAPDYFADQVTKSVTYGADLIYIVDSAGGMTPDDIQCYFSAIRNRSDIPIGFHGHNNLGLAVANSLKAIELGASIIDTSLQGFGRSGGNTPTEQLACALSRHDETLAANLIALMDIGEQYIQPLIHQRGLNTIDMISGMSQFHSSYMGIIREYSSRYQVDPRELIMAVSKKNKIDAPNDLVEKEARQLASAMSRQQLTTTRFGFDRYHGDEQRQLSLLKDAADEPES